jgi:hypothetical protein
MAFTDAERMVVGNPTKKTDADKAFANTEFNRDNANTDHDFDISTGNGKHKQVRIDTTAAFSAPVGEAKAYFNTGDGFVITSTGSTNVFVVMSSAGAARVVVDTSGNVGIGTASPASLLDVLGSNIVTTIRSASDQTNQGWAGAFSVELSNTGTTDNNWNGIVFTDTLGGGALAGIQIKNISHANNYGEIHLATRGAGGYASRLVIDSSGNVGIGTASPASLLDVSHTGNATAARITNQSTATAIWMGTFHTTTQRTYLGHQNSTGGGLVTSGIANAGVFRADAGMHLSAGSAATTGVTIDSTGKVGIGTVSPTDLLTVSEAAASADVTIERTSTYTGTNTLGSLFFSYATDVVASIQAVRNGADDAADLYFGTQSASGGNTTRMRIRTDGDIDLGVAALATTAVAGFANIPSCAGTPTGVPTPTTGLVSMVYDSTNNKLYIHDGAWTAIS